MELKTEARGIQKLQVKAKVVEDKDEEGEVIGAHVVTTVTFEVNCEPGKFDGLLLAVANEHPVNAFFDSPQLALNIPDTEK
ncbi:MAG: hypothetical protein WC639_04765 [Patescibacteria group bacterium]|jgi:hypothetical protein